MIADRITTRIKVTWEIPWWWSVLGHLPMFQSARRLGHEEERAATIVFFRRRAAAAGDNTAARRMLDDWADFFAGPRAA